MVQFVKVLACDVKSYVLVDVNLLILLHCVSVPNKP